jgi:hypothetical protein
LRTTLRSILLRWASPICIYVDLLTGYGRWRVFLRGIGAFFTGRSPLLRNALPRLGEGRTGIAPAKGEVNLLVLVDLDVDGFQASVGLFDSERDNVAFGQISKATGLNVRKMDKNALGFAGAIRFVAVGKPPASGLLFSFCFQNVTTPVTVALQAIGRGLLGEVHAP